MTHPVLEQLRSGHILLSDGAMGTELHRHGLPSGKCPEEYNISHPDIVRGIYRTYFEAGSDIIETNTFGGTRARLRRHDMEEKVSELNRSAVDLARSVCPNGKFVAGSIGPTGLLMEPYGPTSGEEVRDMFAEQIEAVVEAGVDLLFIETMMDINEAEIAVQTAREITDIPISVTMTYEVGQIGPRTSWGVDPETAVTHLENAGADIIGSNCGRGFDEMVTVVEIIRSLTKKYILAQANAGTPILEDGETVFKETPEDAEPKVKNLLNAGTNILGGCCGTGPDHIRMMRQLIDEFQ